MRVVRVLLDETIGGGNGGFRLILPVIGVSDLDLWLLRVTPVWLMRLQGFKLFDGFLIAVLIEVFLCIVIHYFGRSSFCRAIGIRLRSKQTAGS